MHYTKTTNWYHSCNLCSLNTKNTKLSYHNVREYYLVTIFAPYSVIKMVCSAWAHLEPSSVTKVQPSSSSSVCLLPWLIAGSIVNVMPGFITPGYLLTEINNV